MAKYTSEQVKAMSYVEWMETIANELNAAGYKGAGYNESLGRFQNNNAPYEVRDARYFFSGAIDNAEHYNYLKSIGLIDNGRCPLCGAEIKGTIYTYTNGLHPEETYHICKDCYKEGMGMSINPANKQGCIVALLLLPFSAIKGLFSTIANLFQI